VHFPGGWHTFFNSAERRGYAGVAVYSRREPDEVLTKLGGAEFDSEGRYLELRFGRLSVVSLYLPSGSAGPERQASKDRFLEFFLPHLKRWIGNGRDYVLCGDWNIAHRQIDLRNWKSNQKNSGCLPDERAWLNALVDKHGWIDSYRTLKPDGEDYTWWSARGAARANNVGWRIDYQIVTPGLRAKLKSCAIAATPRFSDHAPYIVDYAD
jgi:exodeoxyribonuclease-3